MLFPITKSRVWGSPPPGQRAWHGPEPSSPGGGSLPPPLPPSNRHHSVAVGRPQEVARLRVKSGESVGAAHGPTIPGADAVRGAPGAVRSEGHGPAPLGREKDEARRCARAQGMCFACMGQTHVCACMAAMPVRCNSTRHRVCAFTKGHLISDGEEGGGPRHVTYICTPACSLWRRQKGAT